MIVTIYKLDNPLNKHTWFKEEYVISSEKDIEKIIGFSGDYIYYEVKLDGSYTNELKSIVNEIILNSQTKNSSEMISYLFDIIRVLNSDT